MKKRFLALFLAIVMVVSLLPVTAFADGDTVSYVDENGAEKSATAVKLTSDNTSWSGWLYVDPATEINDKITLTGDTFLIVKDGMQQSTAYGGIDTGSYTLTIYGQSEGTGRFSFWGITGIDGGCEGTDGTSGGDAQVAFVGNLTVCGATVGVYGGQGGNGGDGDFGDYGGQGGSGGKGGKGAAAINGTITVKGGDVTVEGGQGGYGGDGGPGGDGDWGGDGGNGGNGGNGADGAVAINGSAVIYGGKLTVTGGGGGWGRSGGSGGWGGDGESSGGNGGDGGKGGNGGNGAVAVSGTVKVYGGEATLTGGAAGNAGSGGSVGGGGSGDMSDGSSGSPLGGGTKGAASCAMDPATAGDVTVAGGTLTLTAGANTLSAVKSATGLPAKADVKSIEVQTYGNSFAEWNGTDPLTGFYAIRITAEFEEASGDSVNYIDETGASKTATDATKLETSTTTWSGWMYVDGTVTINSAVTLSGDTNLILKDGATLTVNGGISGDKTLTVYAQSAGTGTLIVNGADRNDSTSGNQGNLGDDGIGGKGGDGGQGNQGTDGGAGITGNLTVNGGNVTVTGGKGGKGGSGGEGGEGGANYEEGNGGNGGDGGKGGNGGCAASNGTVTVNGGGVTLNGGESGYVGNGGSGGTPGSGSVYGQLGGNGSSGDGSSDDGKAIANGVTMPVKAAVTSYLVGTSSSSNAEWDGTTALTTYEYIAITAEAAHDLTLEYEDGSAAVAGTKDDHSTADYYWDENTMVIVGRTDKELYIHGSSSVESIKFLEENWDKTERPYVYYDGGKLNGLDIDGLFDFKVVDSEYTPLALSVKDFHIGVGSFFALELTASNSLTIDQDGLYANISCDEEYVAGTTKKLTKPTSWNSSGVSISSYRKLYPTEGFTLFASYTMQEGDVQYYVAQTTDFYTDEARTQLFAEGKSFDYSYSVIENNGKVYRGETNTEFREVGTYEGQYAKMPNYPGTYVYRLSYQPDSVLYKFQEEYILTVTPKNTTVYDVWVGGIRVTEQNKNDVLGDADGAATTVKYDPMERILTLDGAHIKSTDGCGIRSASDLFVVVKSDSTIEVSGTTTLKDEYGNCGIYVCDDAREWNYHCFELTGDGDLTIKVGKAEVSGHEFVVQSGISAYDITVDMNGKLYVELGGISGDESETEWVESYAINSFGSGVAFKNADATLIGGDVSGGTEANISGATNNAYISKFSGYLALLSGTATGTKEQNLAFYMLDPSIQDTVTIFGANSADPSDDYFLQKDPDLPVVIKSKNFHGLTVKNGEADATADTDYAWEGDVLHIKTSGLTLSGTTTSESIVVDEGVETLTLNGVKIIPTTTGIHTGIASYSDDLAITLVGNNVIGNAVDYDEETTLCSDYYVLFGMGSSGNLTFTGNGSLTIYDGEDGIYANGDVTFDDSFSGTVTIEDFGKSDKCAIYAKANIGLFGGTFNLTSYTSNAINARANIKISGNADVTAQNNGKYTAIYADGSITITTSGTVTADARCDGTGEYPAIGANGGITIGGSGTVNAYADDASALYPEGDMLIKDSASVNAQNSGKYDAIFADGSITITTSGTVTADARCDGTGTSPAIGADGGITIGDSGTVNAYADDASALYCGGDMLIKDSAGVNAQNSGEYTTIWSETNIVLNTTGKIVAANSGAGSALGCNATLTITNVGKLLLRGYLEGEVGALELYGGDSLVLADGLTFYGSANKDAAEEDITGETTYQYVGGTWEAYSLFVDDDLAQALMLKGTSSGDCTYAQKVAAPENGETYQLKLGGKDMGWFKFEAVDGGWKIMKTAKPGLLGTILNPYLAMKDGKLSYTDQDNATVWTYKNGAFYTTEKTTQKVKSSYGILGWLFGWGSKTTTKEVTTTYYLSTVTENAKLSTNCVKAELYEEVSGEHDYKYVSKGNGTHDKVCRNCNDTVNEPCVYDEMTHKCVCGAYDPSVADVKISVDVKEKTTKQFSGFLFWGTWKNVTTYTATIKTEATGVKVTKVEYQLNGGRWTNGTSVSSNKPIEKLNVRVWDSNGNVHEYTYPNN